MSVRPQILGINSMHAKKDSIWSEWVQPVLHPRRYTMFCCDCALCHQFQFRAVQNPKTGKHHVQWRIKRANLYTQMKRKHKSEKGHIDILKKGEKVVALVDNAMVITLENGLRRAKRKIERRKPRKRK